MVAMDGCEINLAGELISKPCLIPRRNQVTLHFLMYTFTPGVHTQTVHTQIYDKHDLYPYFRPRSAKMLLYLFYSLSKYFCWVLV